MNCKQGDLAILVKSFAGNECKIFTCLELDLSTHDKCGNPWAYTPRWKIDITINSILGNLIDSVADCNLRPLRDSDGEDEMLRIAVLRNKWTALLRKISASRMLFALRSAIVSALGRTFWRYS